MSKKLFCVVAGPRLGGKTTLAGTLPGNTVLLQAAVKESGSRSAVKLAKRKGNGLLVETFNDIVHLRALVERYAKEPEVHHLYIDGYSAINDMRFGEADIQKSFKKNNFEAYALHGKDMSDLCEWLKGFTFEPYSKNVFLTCALKIKEEDVVLECKGQMAVTAITKLGEGVLTCVLMPQETGPAKRVLITKTIDQWPGRVDGTLDDENPGMLEPDLSLVLKLLEA